MQPGTCSCSIPKTLYRDEKSRCLVCSADIAALFLEQNVYLCANFLFFYAFISQYFPPVYQRSTAHQSGEVKKTKPVMALYSWKFLSSLRVEFHYADLIICDSFPLVPIQAFFLLHRDITHQNWELFLIFCFMTWVQIVKQCLRKINTEFFMFACAVATLRVSESCRITISFCSTAHVCHGVRTLANKQRMCTCTAEMGGMLKICERVWQCH